MPRKPKSKTPTPPLFPFHLLHLTFEQCCLLDAGGAAEGHLLHILRNSELQTRQYDRFLILTK